MSIFDQIASAVAADFVTGPTVNPQYQAPQRTAAEGEDTRSSAATLCRAWVGLTDEEIWESDGYKVAITDQETRWLYRFAKEIEAKLKEKNT